MRLFSLAPVLLLPFAAAAPAAPAVDDLAERASQIESAAAAQAIVKSNANVLNIIEVVGVALNDFKPGSVLPKTIRTIIKNEQTIRDDLQANVATAMGAPAFSAADARRITASLARLSPGFDALGDNLEQHKKSFKSVAIILNFSKQLATILTAQQTAVKQLAADLSTKVPASQRQGLSRTATAIVDRLGQTIKVFGCKGLLCVPGGGGGGRGGLGQ